MKKLLLMIMLLAGVSFLANAQTKAKRSPEQKAAHLTQKLQKSLALNADQSAKVKTILFKRATQMDSLKLNASKTDRKLNRLSARKILLATDDELKKVFTADQQTTYAKLKADMKSKMKGRMARHGAKAPAQKAQHMTQMLQKKLSLNADQYAKVNTILLKRATQIDSLRANRGTADRKQSMQSRKVIITKADAELKAVLNADQQKTYTELKSQMKEKMKARRAGKTPSEG